MINSLEFVLTQGELLSQIIQKQWKEFEFSPVWTSRYFSNGKYIEVCTDSSWTRKMTQENWRDPWVDHLYRNYSAQDPYSCISWSCDDFLGTDIFDFLRAFWGVQSGHLFYFSHEHGIDVIGIASHHSRLTLLKILRDHEPEIADGIAILRKFIRDELNNGSRQTSPPSDNVRLTRQIPIYLFDIERQITHRQLQVLGFLAQGHTYKSIAEILDLSPRTIEHQAQKLRLAFGSKYQQSLLEEFHCKGYYDLYKYLCPTQRHFKKP
jgi:DNA-binding CsgD family transcriptional regulator